MEVVRRRFDLADQHSFARLSGDSNPIHLDRVFARRSMFGVPIVHGIHLALWAIGEQGRDLPPRSLTSIKAAFTHPIPVNAIVECHWTAVCRPCRIELVCQDQVAARIDLDWSHEISDPVAEPIAGVPPFDPPAEPAREVLAGLKGSLELYLAPQELTALLPEVSRQLPPVQTAGLLATTRLVGGRCPGLNSVYSSFAFQSQSGHPSNCLEFAVKSFDERFGALSLKLKAPGWIGVANAFLRPSLTRQESYRSVATRVNTGEFAGLRALVVGGSRGLGEVAAKLLCAGGASVTLTYFSGSEDAAALVEEISAGGGQASAMKLDVTAPHAELPLATDLLVYMSTPFIFSAVKGRFSSELFDHFSSHYVHGFAKLCLQLAASHPLRVLYPSSTAIDEVPANMGEYAAAKAAAEVTCRYLEICHKGLRIHRPRFGRLATDQTGSIVPVQNADPVPAILNELRLALAT